MRIVFPFIAHVHQIPHALPIAAELAARQPGFEVTIATVSDQQERLAREVLASYLPAAPLRFHRLGFHGFDRWRGATGEQNHWKQLTLYHNREFFRGFDSVVTPEQTTLFLRGLLPPHTRLIWTRHGAGDRDSGFSSRIRGFDFVLMSGAKIERRLLERELIRPGRYATGIYAKFDWLRARRRTAPPLFANGRPTVVYNPHFRSALSSWPLVGRDVLEQLASSSRYNVVFAPHIRLFDGKTPSAAESRLFDRLRSKDNVLIDLGSDRSLDATYTLGADLYLGDVSSQAAEFVSIPRPCLFLNPRRTPWRNLPAYRSWTLGDVVDSAAGLEDSVTRAFDRHAGYRDCQLDYVAETFGVPTNVSSAITGADAIATFLRSATRQAPRAASVGLPLSTAR